MIILDKNRINTTTQLTTTNGTTTLANLFDRNKNTSWITDNAGTDATSATLRVIFASTLTVSRIFLANHNLKNFTIRPNTTTASFSPAIAETTNSATYNYYALNSSTAVKDVIITANSTIVANQEKNIAEFFLSGLLYDFVSDRLPSAEGYKPRIEKKQTAHEMSDGGIILYNISSKFSAEIEIGFVPTATVNSLRTIYDSYTPVVFVPLETITSWDGGYAECVWLGDFEFLEFSDNNYGNGYRGIIRLKQTPGGSY